MRHRSFLFATLMLAALIAFGTRPATAQASVEIKVMDAVAQKTLAESVH